METATVETVPFEIPECRWPDFVEKFNKLARKAKRLGCPAVSYTVIGEKVVERERLIEIDGEQSYKRYKLSAKVVVVTGPRPKLNGWTLIARLENLASANTLTALPVSKTLNLVHTVPSYEGKVEARFRDSGTICEHCNTKRRRAEVYVVQNEETGEQKQVGRNCLADFLGHSSPETIARVCEYLLSFRDTLDSDGWFNGAWDRVIDADEVLALTAAYIRKFGWVSKRDADYKRLPSTASLVFRHWSMSDVDRKEAKQDLPDGPSAEDGEEAAAALRWVREVLAKQQELNEYQRNLAVLCVQDVALKSHIGILCSAVSAYQRAMNRLREAEGRREKEAKARAVSQHVGSVGKRLRDLTGTVEMAMDRSNDWGAVTLLKLSDDNGNLFTWFASGHKRFVAGDRVKFTGTVKRHTEYKGAKETQLTRVVLEKE